MLLALGGGVGNQAMSRGTGWMRAIGRASYEIYLVHMIVILALIDVFKRLESPLATIPLWYVAMLLLSLFAGFGVSRYYSEPLNRRLRTRHHCAHDDVSESTGPDAGGNSL